MQFMNRCAVATLLYCMIANTPAADGAGSVEGARRYALLFGAQLNVVGAVKLPPELALTLDTSSMLPAGKAVKLGATIRHIDASEIAGLQFLDDGIPIATAIAGTYDVTHVWPNTSLGARSLSVRLIDSDGVSTTSPPVGVTVFKSDMLGAFAGVSVEADGRWINGWACSTGISAPVEVDLYFGTSKWNAGTQLKADAPSAPSVSAACGTSSLSHGFRIRITDAMYIAHNNQPVLVRAKSPVGEPHTDLGGPLLNSAVKGVIDGIVEMAGVRYVSGWACSTGMSAPIQVKLYRENSFDTVLATVTTDRASEPAVQAACESGGSHHRFAIPITSQMYLQHSGVLLRVRGESPALGSPATPFGNAFQINLLPTAGAPQLSPPAYTINHQGDHPYVEGERPTLSAEAADQDGGIAAVDFWASSWFLCNSTLAPPAALVTASCMSSELPIGSPIVITARATDDRGASAISAGSAISVVAPTPNLTSGQLLNPNANTGYQIELSGSNFFAAVRVRAYHPGTNAQLSGDYLLTPTTPGKLTFELSPTHQPIFEDAGVDLQVFNRTPGLASGVEHPSLGKVHVRGHALKLRKPVSGGYFAAGQALLMEAAYTGTVALQRVEFVAEGEFGSQVVGRAMTAPYVAVWNEVPIGTHSVRARGYRTVGSPIDSPLSIVEVLSELILPACPIFMDEKESSIGAVPLHSVGSDAGMISGRPLDGMYPRNLPLAGEHTR
jgi:hypothetical protein